MRANDDASAWTSEILIWATTVRKVNTPLGAGSRHVPQEEAAAFPTFDLYKFIPLLVLIIWLVLDAAAIRFPS